MKHFNPIYTALSAIFIIFFIALTGVWQSAEAQKDIKTISILPFKINAARNSTDVQDGILQMFYSRLSWKDKVIVVPPGTIKTLLPDIKDASRTKGINDIADLTHSDFVLVGTLTRLGGSFSIDAQVYDIENKRHMSFFEQSKENDALVNKISQIAAMVNKEIFGRSTSTWEKIEEEKQAYIQEMKRKNPEYMMKNPQWQKTEESPGWKIWKYLF